MSALPQISEAEYEVMKIVWKYAPINTNEITEKLLGGGRKSGLGAALSFVARFIDGVE